MATGRFVALAEQTDDDEYAAQYHGEPEAHGAELAEWHGEQDEEDAWPDEEYEEDAGYDAYRGEEAPDEAPHGYARIIRQAQRPPIRINAGHRTFASAPRAKRPPEVPVRRASAPPIPSPTGDILAWSIGEEVGLAEEVVIATLNAVGGEPYSSAANFGFIPEKLVMETVQGFTPEVAVLSPMMIGQVMRWHSRCKEVSTSPPGSSNDHFRGQLPPQIIQLQHPPPLPPPKRKIVSSLEQGETEETVELLDKEDLKKM